jgi:hypothetical protein
MTMKNGIKVFSYITGGCYQQEYWILELQHRERKRSGAKGGDWLTDVSLSFILKFRP